MIQDNRTLCLLVTGGAGFIGSSFVRRMVQSNSDNNVLCLDKLTYAGNLENLESVSAAPNYRFLRGDICEPAEVQAAFKIVREQFGRPVDAVVHFAAETHVDRSIDGPRVFLETNILGTENLLNSARKLGVERFVHISTDEVYGTLGPDDPAFTETSSIAPNSPYAASKAGSDLIVRAYGETYGLPVLITRCSNNYGPYQFPEKLIPLMIANAQDDQPLPVYGDGSNIRDWIYVDDHSAGVEAVLRRGQPGEVYNLGGHAEKPNIEVVHTLLRLLGKPESLIRFVSDRLGHDLRYAMNTVKVQEELGWQPTISFDEGLKRTVEWYVTNAAWCGRVRSGAYREYYNRLYAERLK